MFDQILTNLIFIEHKILRKIGLVSKSQHDHDKQMFQKNNKNLN